MTRLIILLLTLIVSSCATYSEMQSKTPVFEGQTKKSPEDYIACAAPRILEVWSLARVIPDGNGRIIVVTDSNGVGITMTLTATPNGDGSRVALRQMASLRTFDREWNLSISVLLVERTSQYRNYFKEAAE